MHRSRHHWVFTAAAIFLLLFTAGDLAYPAMCGEDGDASMVTATQATLSITSAADSTPSHVDDCFCCCGHVIAGAVFHIASPSTTETARFALTAHRVSAAPSAAYRPPRAS